LESQIGKGVINDSSTNTSVFPHPEDNKTVQWEFPPGNNFVQASRVKRKQEGSVSYKTLRNFSVNYPIARSCIQYIKTKAFKLEWAITPANEDVNFNPDDKRIDELEAFFNHPLGNRSTYREYLEEVIEDYLVIGSIALERVLTKGGEFLGELKTVDASTIRALVDSEGRIPEPPDPAYIQMANGKLIARLTEDELIFRNRDSRTNSMYGLSPIESIILQAESAIKQAKNSLAFFSDGTMPEGFMEMPGGWTKDQIKSFERYFNGILSGHPQWQRKIKMLPQGANWTQIKKPDEINFQRFELWLMKQTCSVFGVPPSDIGFEEDVNRSTSEVQAAKGQERAMRPIAQFLQDIHTDIVQRDFGYTDLAFKFLDVDPVDRKAEAEIDKIKLQSGVLSVDEIRMRDGLEPTGVDRYVSGKVTFINEEGEERGVEEVQEEDREVEEDQSADEEMQNEKAYQQDMILWRKQSLRALKDGRKFKKFDSAALQDWVVDEVYSQLNKCKNHHQVRNVFKPYLDFSMTNSKKLKDITDALETIAKNPKNTV
jgi:HK97 family phage portal protein